MAKCNNMFTVPNLGFICFQSKFNKMYSTEFLNNGKLYQLELHTEAALILFLKTDELLSECHQYCQISAAQLNAEQIVPFPA